MNWNIFELIKLAKLYSDINCSAERPFAFRLSHSLVRLFTVKRVTIVTLSMLEIASMRCVWNLLFWKHSGIAAARQHCARVKITDTHHGNLSDRTFHCHLSRRLFADSDTADAECFCSRRCSLRWARWRTIRLMYENTLAARNQEDWVRTKAERKISVAFEVAATK